VKTQKLGGGLSLLSPQTAADRQRLEAQAKAGQLDPGHEYTRDRRQGRLAVFGGPGSGDYGHAGRPGEVGGSAGVGGSSGGDAGVTEAEKPYLEAWLIGTQEPKSRELVGSAAVAFNLSHAGLPASRTGLDVVRSLYARTQAKLAGEGIDRITLYRGLEDAAKLDGKSSMRAAPLSSWSARPEMAASHAQGEGGRLISITVPRSQIVAYYGTGMGSPVTEEYVLRGGVLHGVTVTRPAAHFGGPGSGDFGHAGRQGQVGGSTGGGGSAELEKMLRGLPIVHDASLRQEATTRGGAIRVSPHFDSRPAGEQRAVLIHEAAHLKGLDDWYLKNHDDWNLAAKSDLGHFNGQTTPGEIMAEAYAVAWTEPSYLETHAPALIPLVREGAAAVGLPLPPLHFGGPGSGDYGHAGRPGTVGGSASGGGSGGGHASDLSLSAWSKAVNQSNAALTPAEQEDAFYVYDAEEQTRAHYENSGYVYVHPEDAQAYAAKLAAKYAPEAKVEFNASGDLDGDAGETTLLPEQPGSYRIDIDKDWLSQAMICHEMAHVLATEKTGGVVGHGASFRQAWLSILQEQMPSLAQGIAAELAKSPPAQTLAEPLSPLLRLGSVTSPAGQRVQCFGRRPAQTAHFGGPGSGDFGHSGRKGEVGGSASGGGAAKVAYYHGTTAELKPGDLISPGHQPSHARDLPDQVWVSDNAWQASKYGAHTYEVMPHDTPKARYRGNPNHELHTSGATVVREVPISLILEHANKLAGSEYDRAVGLRLDFGSSTSGNYGHAGRPGQVGGSAPGGGAAANGSRGYHPTGASGPELREYSDGLAAQSRFFNQTLQQRVLQGLSRERAHVQGTPAYEVGPMLDPEQTKQVQELAQKATSGQSRDQVRDAVVADIAQRSGLSYRQASELTLAWAFTSSDSEPASLALQASAAERFGLDKSPDLVKSLAAHPEGVAAYRPLADKYVAAVYERTQEELAKAGVSELWLARGMNWTPGQMPPEFAATGNVEVNLNPLSAYSLDPQVAYNFATGVATGTAWRPGRLVYERVPAALVFSTALSGPGTLREREVIVLGGRHQVYVTPTQLTPGQAQVGTLYQAEQPARVWEFAWPVDWKARFAEIAARFGGPGSGDFEHAGRKGEVGGSTPGGGGGRDFSSYRVPMRDPGATHAAYMDLTRQIGPIDWAKPMPPEQRALLDKYGPLQDSNPAKGDLASGPPLTASEIAHVAADPELTRGVLASRYGVDYQEFSINRVVVTGPDGKVHGTDDYKLNAPDVTPAMREQMLSGMEKAYLVSPGTMDKVKSVEWGVPPADTALGQNVLGTLYLNADLVRDPTAKILIGSSGATLQGVVIHEIGHSGEPEYGTSRATILESLSARLPFPPSSAGVTGGWRDQVAGEIKRNQDRLATQTTDFGKKLCTDAIARYQSMLSGAIEVKVSNYAGMNTGEFFAEMFRVYVTDPTGMAKEFPQQYAYISAELKR
jgi:hypothetical protein